MSVRSRLILCFGVVTAVLAVPTLLATVSLAHMRRHAVEGRSGQAATVARLGRMQATLAELDRLERSFIATSDPQLGRLASQVADSLRHDYARLVGGTSANLGSSLGQVVVDVGVLTRAISQEVDAGRVAEATDSFVRLMTVFDEASRQFIVVADSVDAAAGRDLVDAQLTSTRARTRTLLGLAIALLLTLVVAGFTTHALITPLRRLGRASARIADGKFDLPDDLPYHRHDEIGELSNSFAAMARRLAELDRTKAEFLGVVSHELKTPLNVIKAYAEVIEDELGDNVSDAHRGLITAVGEQATAMSRRVSRLMDISRLEAGTYRLSMEDASVEELATGVRMQFQRSAEQKGILLDIHIAGSAPARAVLDVDIVRDEVLGNLIVNALRHTPSGGWVQLVIEGDRGGLLLTVTDSGPGIPEEARPFIFRKHYVVDRARALGSGLGLAIAKEMVALHGGLITLEPSSSERGARFKVALPLGAAVANLEVPAGEMIRPAAQGDMAWTGPPRPMTA